MKNLYKNVSFKKGDLIGIAKLPTEAEITEFKIAEFKRKDAEIARQISLDLNKEKEISTNLTPIVTKGQLISKCPFVVIVWTKTPTIFFENFYPVIWKVVKSYNKGTPIMSLLH